MAKINPVKRSKGKSQKTKTKEKPTALVMAEMLPKGELQFIPINKIVESSTNPRSEFDDVSLNELAASIKTQGLVNPITVRFVPGIKLYQVIAGARRYRACKIAGLKEINCIVMDLQDNQVLEVQIIENLQRKDVHPLDEAAGYKALIEKGYSIKQIAGQVGKSDEYISQRLKLVDLLDGIRDAFREGKIFLEHAKQISRLQPDDQIKAMEFVKRYSWNGEVMAPAKLREYIKSDLMLKLHASGFDKKDKYLVDGVGPCTECMKRTGFNTALFADIGKTDMCTDSVCFNNKVTAHVRKKIIEFTGADKGFCLISDSYRPAKKDYYCPDAGSFNVLGSNEFKELKKKEECKNAVPGIYVEGEERGRIIQICADKTCKKHWKGEGEARTVSSNGRPLPSPDQRYSRALEILQEKETGDLMESCLDNLATITGFTDDIKKVLAHKLFLSIDHKRRFLEKHAIECDEWDNDERDKAFITYVKVHENIDGLIFELAHYLDVSFNRDGITRNEECYYIIDSARRFVPDFDNIEIPIKANYKELKDKKLKSFMKTNGREPQDLSTKHEDMNMDDDEDEFEGRE
jgi:ParB/RepB/Spo0J family partition protein